MIKCKAIQERKSVRLYNQSINIRMDEILECIEAAGKAPSHYNKQPWIFRIIISQEIIGDLASVLTHNRWIRKVPVVIIIGVEKAEGVDRLKNYLSLGAAVENLILEAQQRGFATCWIGECLGKELEGQLQWPIEYEIASIVSMGYSREYEIKDVPKKSIQEMLI